MVVRSPWGFDYHPRSVNHSHLGINIQDKVSSRLVALVHKLLGALFAIQGLNYLHLDVNIQVKVSGRLVDSCAQIPGGFVYDPQPYDPQPLDHLHLEVDIQDKVSLYDQDG
jgi:hypothetical protein